MDGRGVRGASRIPRGRLAPRQIHHPAEGARLGRGDLAADLALPKLEALAVGGREGRASFLEEAEVKTLLRPRRSELELVQDVLIEEGGRPDRIRALVVVVGDPAEDGGRP